MGIPNDWIRIFQCEIHFALGRNIYLDFALKRVKLKPFIPLRQMLSRELRKHIHV